MLSYLSTVASSTLLAECRWMDVSQPGSRKSWTNSRSIQMVCPSVSEEKNGRANIPHGLTSHHALASEQGANCLLRLQTLLERTAFRVCRHRLGKTSVLILRRQLQSMRAKVEKVDQAWWRSSLRWSRRIFSLTPCKQNRTVLRCFPTP